MQKITYYIAAIFGLIVTTTVFASADDCVKQADQMQQLLFAGEYTKVEPAIRKCVEMHPKEVVFLSKLDIVLNGQGKYSEASKLRKQILDIWHQYYEADWRAKGSPVRESSWARMIVSTKDYNVIGVEYFVPQLLNEDPPLKAFYKVIALPRSQDMKARLFKLEMSQWDDTRFHVLREQLESGGKQIVQYGDKRPAFHRMVKDAAAYLEKH
jgi:hypothetical protein